VEATPRHDAGALAPSSDGGAAAPIKDVATPRTKDAEPTQPALQQLGDVWVYEEACGNLDYRVIPLSSAAVFQPMPICSDPTLVASNDGLEPCTDDAQCQSSSNGRCVVQPQRVCVYANREPLSCSDDTDCAAASAGFCRKTCPNDDVGQCVLHRPCDTDADCVADSGGQCTLLVERFGQCEYPDCWDDVDCAGDDRCGCGHCVHAECRSDADCAGHCRLSTYYCLLPDRFACEDDAGICAWEDGEECPCRNRDGEWSCYSVECGPH
jgi:hypothetical protein